MVILRSADHDGGRGSMVIQVRRGEGWWTQLERSGWAFTLMNALPDLGDDRLVLLPAQFLSPLRGRPHQAEGEPRQNGVDRTVDEGAQGVGPRLPLPDRVAHVRQGI